MKTILSATILACVGLTFRSAAIASERQPLPGSIRELGVLMSPAFDQASAAPRGNEVRIVRRVLSAQESEASLRLVVSLRLRNYDELQQRIQKGELVPREEMETKYLPLLSDYNRVVAWLGGQGFAQTLTDASHTNIFIRGTVAQATQGFDVSFARVATAAGEFTSAISTPSLPAEIASSVLGIDGLQPSAGSNQQPSHSALASQAIDDALHAKGIVTPDDLATAYNIPGNLSGSGQTIAIILNATPTPSDLTLFWSTLGSSASLANFTTIKVDGGPTPQDQADAVSEVTGDIQHASAMAPGAKIRLYAFGTKAATTLADSFTPGVQAALTELLNDLPANPGLHQASFSSGILERDLPAATLASLSQSFTQLAAAGVSFFSASGDSGSNPNASGTLGYGAANSLGVFYPASDPSVTGVGGTSVNFTNDWRILSETAWALGEWPSLRIDGVDTLLCTSGGVSSVFNRPAWQTGPGVPAGTRRCVPDVAAMATGNRNQGLPLFLHVLNGQVLGDGSGTSLSSPLWAGLAALINEARASAGLPPVGLLGPKIYPLLGTDTFNDVTTGGNGAYNSGPGYDLVTGMGSPNLTKLVRALTSVPALAIEPNSVAAADGQTVAFTVTATGAGPLNYQWSVRGVPLASATESTLLLDAVSAADTGAYTCKVTNEAGSVISRAATLALAPAGQSSRLSNLSVRTNAGTGAETLIVGFVVAGNGSKNVLLRGIGPTLIQFGVTGVLANPRLALFDSGGGSIASNTGWGGSPTLNAAFNAVGAFGLPPNSTDAALLSVLPAGAYSAQISPATGATGVALAEIYDLDGSASTARLVNLSARTQAGSDAQTLIVGLFVAGGASKTILIRGIGPTLAQFGVAGALASPQLRLHATVNGQDTIVATNGGWGGGPTLTRIFTRLGAFALPANSNDDALVVTLQPGAYSAELTGFGGATGIALVEIYETP
ncbi:MAG TPA: protease pro-enzyme activation domain-containing protein [Bryobacteraceae bacterium]|nr:protease pro-enzyme activation domain-containing protein [Bryobacteraceae bacterium]